MLISCVVLHCSDTASGGIGLSVRLTNALCCAVLCCDVSDPYSSQQHKQQDVSKGIYGPEFEAYRRSQASQQHKNRRSGSSGHTASLSSLDFFGLFSHDVGFDDDDQPAIQEPDLELEQEQLQEQADEPYLSQAADEREDDREQEAADQYARDDDEHRQQAAAEEEEAALELEHRREKDQMQALEEYAGEEGERRQLTEAEAQEEQMRAYETLARQEEERRRQIRQAEELAQPTFGAQHRPRDVRRPVMADEVRRHAPQQHAAHDSRDKQLSEAEELRRAFNVDWPQHTKQQALCWQ